MKKSFYLSLLFLFSPLIASASSPFSGFVWIGNDSGSGIAMNNPSALAIRMDGLNLEDGKIVGSGEIGGAKNDFVLKSQINPISSINGMRTGYLRFDQGAPSDDCFGTGDCYPAKWTAKLGSINQMEGFISGWAKMEIGAPGKYPDVWVHFRSPADPSNYPCSGDTKTKDENYFVCSDQDGKFHGFAWSSGVVSTSISDNPGLGFLDFSEVSFLPDAFTQQVSPQQLDNTSNTVDTTSQQSTSQAKQSASKTCDIYFVDSIAKEKTICQPNDKVVYKASADFADIKDYTWQCDGEAPQTNNSVSHECSGDKPPTLIISTINDEDDIACNSMTKVLVDDTATCQVEAREFGSNGSFSQNLSITSGDTVVARITGKCLGSTKTNWNQTNLNPISNDNQVLKALAPLGGDASINASITTSKGDKIDCGEVKIKVKEKIKWGN